MYVCVCWSGPLLVFIPFSLIMYIGVVVGVGVSTGVSVFVDACLCVFEWPSSLIHSSTYGVATISGILKIIGILCRISSLL